MLSAADAVCRALVENGVEFIFGIPGTHNLEFYRSIPKYELKHILLRHEQSLGYAADGYARVSGKPGICLTTSGPGLTNILTAMATSYADSIPLLVIAPGVPRAAVRADVGGLHEMRDQRAMVEGITEFAFRASSVAHGVSLVHEAFARWETGRGRPVYIEIPIDVLTASLSETEYPVKPHTSSFSDNTADLDEIVDLLNTSERIAFLAGGGARNGGKSISLIADKLGSGVITSVNGKGIIDEDSPWSLGASLRLGAAQSYLENADTAVLVGTELGDSDLWEHKPDFHGKVIRIDVDASQLNKNAKSTFAVRADARTVLADIERRLPTRPMNWLAQQRQELAGVRSKVQEEALRDAGMLAELNSGLREVLPKESILSGDSSQVSYYGSVHFFSMSERGRFIYPCGFATLGYSLPAAIGAQLADASRPVVALMGDGAFQFTAMELSSVHDLQLPVVVLVVNNHGFAQIEREMRESDIRPLGVHWAAPEFGTLARACGVETEKARSISEMQSHVSKALGQRKPILIEIDANELY